jgi:hypothetical protein
MRKISLSRRILVGVVAVFAALVTVFGITVNANAVTNSGSSAGCEYSVSNDNYRTTATAYNCSTVQPHIKYQNNATGTITDSYPAYPVADPVGVKITVQSGQVTGPNTILDNWAVYNPGRGGVPAFTIHAVK